MSTGLILAGCCCSVPDGEACSLCTGTVKAQYRIVLSGLSWCELPEYIYLWQGGTPYYYYWAKNIDASGVETAFWVTQDEANPCLWNNTNIGTVSLDVYYAAVNDSSQSFFYIHRDIQVAAALVALGGYGGWQLGAASADDDVSGTYSIFSGYSDPEATCAIPDPISNTLTCAEVTYPAPYYTAHKELTEDGTATIS